MSTPAQQSANQANAQKSTGPTTPEGKARSATNSQIHGLCAKHNVIGPEDQSDFDRMATNYVLDLMPESPVEHTLFTEIVGAAWQLARVNRMQTEACAGKTTLTEILDDEVLQKKLDRLARHHTRIERTFHRCLKELKTLQAQRKKEEALAHPTFVPERISESIDEQLARLNASALSAISQRSQSAPSAGESGILTPKELAEIDRDFDRMEAQTAAELRKRARKAA